MYQVDANQDSEITVVEAGRQRAWPNHGLRVRSCCLGFKEGPRSVVGRRVEVAVIAVGFRHAGMQIL